MPQGGEIFLNELFVFEQQGQLIFHLYHERDAVIPGDNGT